MNNELQSFVFIASHDLQEPLRKINTYTDLISQTESESLSEKVSNYFNKIQTCSKRMHALINDLLTYSQANTIDHDFQITDLNEIVKNVEG